MTKQEIKSQIQENIKRLEKTISMTNTFQKAYIENCKDYVASYRKILISLS